MFNSNKSKPSRIDTLVGAGTRIIGDVQFSGGLHVDGLIKGNVDAPADSSSTLGISDGGAVEGSVAVPNVVLNGTVFGDILARDRLELGATAKVTGNVYYGLIEMAIGAEINGKLIHEPPATRNGQKSTDQKAADRATADQNAAAQSVANAPAEPEKSPQLGG